MSSTNKNVEAEPEFGKFILSFVIYWYTFMTLQCLALISRDLGSPYAISLMA